MVEKTKGNWKKTAMIYLLLVLLVSVIGFFGWYYRKTEVEILSLSHQVREIRNTQKAKVDKLLLERDSSWLPLMAEPLAWLMRQEMLVDDLEQIHRYLAQYVKHENIILMAVLNTDHEIISSTDKKLEGSSADQVLDRSGLRTNKLVVYPGDDVLHVYVPLMGYDKKIGTLYFKYKPKEK